MIIINIDVIMMDGSNSLFPNTSKNFTANIIPNIECIIASIIGNRKNIPICVNNALFISFSSVPIFLNIINLSLLSLDSDNSFNASIAALDIKNIIPK